MAYRLSDEERQLQATVREFAERELAPRGGFSPQWRSPSRAPARI
jgi:alkylation response protein AidB-like acyl-CoA dehydrogenase